VYYYSFLIINNNSFLGPRLISFLRLHYNDINKSLNEAANDNIRKYRADYNNNPPNVVVFMTAMDGTNGRLHSDFIRLLFLQTHRETDRFFTVSGVQSAQSNLGDTCFHFRLEAVLNQLKSKCGLLLSKTASLRVTLNLDDTPSIFRCSSSKTNSVYSKPVNSLVLGCSLS
jgi:hypothetical protein